MNTEIKTKRLYLRKYSEKDLNDYHKLKSDPLVWQFSTQPISENITETRDILDQILKDYENSGLNFNALFTVEDDRYIGEAGVLSFNNKSNRTVIGYNLLPEYWNMGYATEITKGLVSFLFESIRVERIEALVMDANQASQKVLQKNGFRCEGILRNFGHIDGKYFNVCYYGMIKSDYFT